MAEGEFYPLTLTPAFFAGRQVLMVGGGVVAERKIRGLLLARASVIVISPQLTPALSDLAEANQIEWHQREWQSGDLAAFPLAGLIFAATNASEINREIGDAARQAGRLVNLADDGDQSDFIIPAVVRRGPVLLAVNTGGNAALSAYLRELLSDTVGPDYGELADLLTTLRPRVKAEVEASRRPALWQAMIHSSALELLHNGQPAQARRVLENLIEDTDTEVGKS